MTVYISSHNGEVIYWDILVIEYMFTYTNIHKILHKIPEQYLFSTTKRCFLLTSLDNRNVDTAHGREMKSSKVRWRSTATCSNNFTTIHRLMYAHLCDICISRAGYHSSNASRLVCGGNFESPSQHRLSWQGFHVLLSSFRQTLG
jgi:hypothetical protein